MKNNKTRPLKGAENGYSVWGWIIALLVVIFLAGSGVWIWRRAKREKIINTLLEKFAKNDTHTKETLASLKNGMKQLTDKELNLIVTGIQSEAKGTALTAEEEKAFTKMMAV